MGCYDEAHRILEERSDTLTRVAEALLVHETLTGEQIARLVRGETLRLTPETSADSREQIEGARQDEQARHVRKKAVGDGLPLFPEPGPRPA